MNRITALCLVALFTSIFPYRIFAQSGQDIFTLLRSADTSGGRVNIIQENRVKDLVDFHLTQQRASNGVEGYRISIFRDSGQESSANADKVRSGFISKYEDVKCYKVWEYPFYKLYVGDFRTKSEALRFYKLLEKDYPDAFIRKSMIPFSE
ncbi:MAG: SPOR domain-containing protein [Bacteroidales bacterium]|nr:SPOR domain-containing protein [Bacteroidales bacterium]